MKKLQLLGASCAAVVAACLSTPSSADFGFEGLEARNWNPSTETWETTTACSVNCDFDYAEAVYVPALDMTWWRYASGVRGPDIDPGTNCLDPNSTEICPYNSPMTKSDANDYITSLNSMNEGKGAYGINTWRLPIIEPRPRDVDGDGNIDPDPDTYDFTFTCNYPTDYGYWNDSSKSEPAYLHYVVLGLNPSFNRCGSSGGNDWNKVAQAFTAIQQCEICGYNPLYWSGNSTVVEEEGRDLVFMFKHGLQSYYVNTDASEDEGWVWAVTDGDVAQTPIEKLADLIDSVMTTNKNMGLLNSLDSKFNSAIQAMDDANTNNDVAAINSLYAFIYSVDAQRGQLISDEDATALIEAAQAIIDSLSAN